MMAQGAFERGLIIETAGAEDEVVKLLPPLVVTNDAIDRALAILGDIADDFDEKMVEDLRTERAAEPTARDDGGRSDRPHTSTTSSAPTATSKAETWESRRLSPGRRRHGLLDARHRSCTPAPRRTCGTRTTSRPCTASRARARSRTRPPARSTRSRPGTIYLLDQHDQHVAAGRGGPPDGLHVQPAGHRTRDPRRRRRLPALTDRRTRRHRRRQHDHDAQTPADPNRHDHYPSRIGRAARRCCPARTRSCTTAVGGPLDEGQVRRFDEQGFLNVAGRLQRRRGRGVRRRARPMVSRSTR